MWPFTRSKKNRNGAVESKPADPEAACEESESDDEAADRKVRRDAAQKRIVKTLREAQQARDATICVEAEYVKATDERRKKAETASRKAQAQASEVCDTLCPDRPAAAQPREAGAG